MDLQHWNDSINQVEKDAHRAPVRRTSATALMRFTMLYTPKVTT